MELLGGTHQALVANLDRIGNIFYARYITIAPQFNTLNNWKYHYDSFGFPLCAALSRINRLTDLFGEVEDVKCTNRYWNREEKGYFKACLCNAQLKFKNDLIADIIYGKGEVFSKRERIFEVYGDQGKIVFEGEKGLIFQGNDTISINIPPRRGLFKKDTTLVLDYLTQGKPLYINNEQSYYALKVANLAHEVSIR